jgi:HSP20 family molecular chaperone IbpA
MKLLYEGFYGRVLLDPGSARETALINYLNIEETKSFYELMLKVKAGIRDEKIQETLERYKEVIIPGYVAKKEMEEEEAVKVLEEFKNFKFSDVFTVIDKTKL